MVGPCKDGPTLAITSVLKERQWLVEPDLDGQLLFMRAAVSREIQATMDHVLSL